MISVFDLFKIGLGPSSSHTVGPMKAAKAFRDALDAAGLTSRVARLEARLYGSLAWTGKGHATDKAVILGLAGRGPDTMDPDEAEQIFARVLAERRMNLGRDIEFDAARDILFDTIGETPFHPNTLGFRALDEAGAALLEQRWCSIGGGFIVREGETQLPEETSTPLPHPFANAAELLAQGERTGLSIAEMTRANEEARRTPEEVQAYLERIRAAMLDCLQRGLGAEGQLPGGLKVKRRAASIFRQLEAAHGSNTRAAHEIMDYISVFAMAVNEENAAGGRVVTAPTNGAAGVIPSVLRYYRDFGLQPSEAAMDSFVLTATAIGAIFKMNASISGAEVGCQGEVGVAASMAAAGLAAALGGTNAQVENAAEIAMEHHLGLTCDPIGGLVQIPCIERNAFGAVKAINAASLALRGDGSHRVSLDSVVATMRETGRDMSHKYKETSLGGLAVNWVEC